MYLCGSGRLSEEAPAKSSKWPMGLAGRPAGRAQVVAGRNRKRDRQRNETEKEREPHPGECPSAYKRSYLAKGRQTNPVSL